ncbi:hypothetical protein [Pleionea sp. CnH1-48]|uniref:hypothetical protein n=1 Tax=Pleionea sp. CnH1-48 TaxID=2954494 RepID=UPI002097BD3F|nr:hypothetical protein [Pleionea sp. CnH1-48]MCO7225263.1 hypothetical protein [Pleionea sp. CnH1-48]
MDASKLFDFSIFAGELALSVIIDTLPRAIGFGLIGVILSILCLSFVHRRKMYYREKILWNLATKLHYPLWMFAFLIFGMVCGSISATKSIAVKTLDEQLEPFLVSKLPELKEFLTSRLPAQFGDELLTVNDASQYFNEQLSLREEPGKSTSKNGIENYISQELSDRIAIYMMEYTLQEVIKELGLTSGLDDNIVEFSAILLVTVDFSNIEKSAAQATTKIVKKQTKAALNTLYLNALLYFLLFISILCLEPLLYYKWWLPRNKKPQTYEEQNI